MRIVRRVVETQARALAQLDELSRTADNSSARVGACRGTGTVGAALLDSLRAAGLLLEPRGMRFVWDARQAAHVLLELADEHGLRSAFVDALTGAAARADDGRRCAMTTRDDLAAYSRLRNDPAFLKLARRATPQVAAQEFADTLAGIEAEIDQADAAGDHEPGVWLRRRRVMLNATMRLPATADGLPNSLVLCIGGSGSTRSCSAPRESMIWPPGWRLRTADGGTG